MTKDKTPMSPPDYDQSKVPEEIKRRADYVRTKFHGEDVLESLAQGMEYTGVMANEALEAQAYDGNSLADVTLAKDGLPTLDARIRRDVNNLENKKADKAEVSAQLAQIEHQKATHEYVDNKVQAVSLAYKESYATLTDLQTAYPTGNAYNHAVLADGMIYTWNGTAWVNTQIQANGTGIADNSVGGTKLSGDVIKIQDDYASLRSGAIGYYNNNVANTKWLSDNSDRDITLYNFTNPTTPLVFNGTLKTYGLITYSLGSTFSALLKVKATTFGTTRRMLSFFGSGGLELAINSAGNILLSPGGLMTTATLSINQDYLIGISVNNTTKTLRLFINGVLNGEYTLATNTAFSGRDLYIGRNANADNSYFEGTIYKLSMFNVALGDTEMTKESNAMLEETGAILFNTNNTVKPLKTDKILHGSIILNDYLNNMPTISVEKDKKKFMHISADDVITIFKDIYTNAYSSIFDHPVLAFLKNMHDNYGMVFSGYCFYQTKDLTFNLSMMPSTYVSEFKVNADWLKFGYHYLDNNGGNFGTIPASTGQTYYEQGMGELFRICGSFESLDTVPRLHNYAATAEVIQKIRAINMGITGLLTSEDSRQNYHLSSFDNSYIRSHDRLYDYEMKLKLFSTDFRLESVTDVTTDFTSRLTDVAYASRMTDLIVFTHEQFLYDSAMQDKIESCCQFAVTHGYRFDFPMYNI